MSLSLNGSGHLASSTGNPLTVTLSNMSSGDVIIVDIGYGSGSITSLSATGITFDGTKHAGAGTNDRWRGVANSSGTSVVITINFSTSNTAVANAYAISGANTSSSFDSGGPVTGTGSPSDPKSITTVNANTMAIASFTMNSTANPTAGSGFTLVSGADFFCTEYQILSSAQTLSCTMTTGNTDSRAAILDAVVQAGSAVSATSFISFSEW